MPDDNKELKTPLTLDKIQQPSSPKSKKSEKKSKKGLKISKKGKIKYKYKQVPFKWNTYKFLLGYPLKHWKLFSIVSALIITTSVLQATLPMITGQLLDSINDEKQFTAVHRNLSLRFLEILVIYSICQLLRAFTNMVFQEKVYNDMREDVLKQFLSFDLYFFHKYRNGEIISRMTNDLASAKAAVSSNVVLLARNSITLSITLSILFALSWRLAAALIATMPLFALCTTVYSRLSKKFEKIGQEY